MSQMLVAEAEDLYAALQKYQPTLYVKLGQADRFKADLEGHKKYWTEWVPKQFALIRRCSVVNRILRRQALPLGRSCSLHICIRWTLFNRLTCSTDARSYCLGTKLCLRMKMRNACCKEKATLDI